MPAASSFAQPPVLFTSPGMNVLVPAGLDGAGQMSLFIPNPNNNPPHPVQVQNGQPFSSFLIRKGKGEADGVDGKNVDIF
jgi:hypothetical protein